METTWKVGAGSAKKVAAFFSPEDVAELLSVSRRVIYSAIESGRLNAHRIGPRLLRISAADFDTFCVEARADSEWRAA